MAVGMNKREKLSVLGASILVACFLLFQFVISPLLEKKELLDRQLEVKTKIFADMVHLASEYDAISAGIKDSIAYMKPSTTADKYSDMEFSLVEMKLKEIKLSQLISYLHMVETSKNVVFVKRLGITRDDKNKNSISAVLHVETVKS
jgi:general secretion pathway protein M